MNDFDVVHRYIRSMEVFADGDKTINMGQWMEWKSKCYAESRTIPPKEFKEKFKKDCNTEKTVI